VEISILYSYLISAKKEKKLAIEQQFLKKAIHDYIFKEYLGIP
jgi:hypothetical protein